MGLFSSLLQGNNSAVNASPSSAATTPPVNQPYTASAWNTGGSSASFTAGIFNSGYSFIKLFIPIGVFILVILGIIHLWRHK